MAAAAKLRIREYDGVSEDPSLWLRHVVRVGQANQCTEAVRLRQVEASLVGAAELWFENQGADPEHDTWAEFGRFGDQISRGPLQRTLGGRTVQHAAAS